MLDQPVWATSTGLGLGRVIDTTSSPEAAISETTGGPLVAFTNVPVVPPEEREWALLQKSERNRVIRKRITGRTVSKSIRELRYGR